MRSAPCVGPQHNHATLRDARAPRAVGRYSTRRKASGPRATGIECSDHEPPKSVPPTCCSVGAVEPRLMASGGARHELAHNTTTPSPHCAAHASWAIGRYCTGRKACGPRVTGFACSDHEPSKPVPPTCRNVGAVVPWPTVWGGVRPALPYNTTTPSPHCAAREVRGRSADYPRGEKRAGRAKQNSHAAAANLPSPCRRPVAVLKRSSPVRWRGEERAPRWPTTQPRQVRTALCMLIGRSADTPRGEKRAGRAPQDSNAVNAPFRSLCRRPSLYWCG